MILISGAGTNMRAIAEQAAAGMLPIEISAVVSDRADAAGLQIAAGLGIPQQVVSPRDFASREEFDCALADLIDDYRPQLLILAGFMRILGAGFIQRFRGRMLNIHPSLLPKHRGLRTHARALAAGDVEHGVSVHFVTEELDGGPVVLQTRVPVYAGDTEASLAARVRQQEHRIFPEAVGLFASGRLCYRNGKAWLDGRELNAPIELTAGDN